jgi:alpha-galactosidase
MGIVGDLPLGCAAVCNVSISVQRLAVEASIRGDVNLLKQAMMMDPLTGAVCNPPEIWQMTDEMLVALEPWLPQYADSIPAAKTRMAGPLLPTIETEGAARIHTKTVAEMEERKEENRKLAEESDKAKARPAA